MEVMDFSPGSRTHEFFVPGRLCLFGEHSDWAGEYRSSCPEVKPGMCLIAGTDQGLYGRAELHKGAFELRQVGPAGEPGHCNSYPVVPGILKTVAKTGHFDCYAAGTAALVAEEFQVKGLRLDIYRRTLPLKKGLSSSAAVCVLTARAFNTLYNLGLTIEQEMDLAYRGEILAGSECGRMDQACAFGKGRPLLLTFDGNTVDYSVLAPGGEFILLIVDLMGTKDTRRILHDLNAAFIRGDPALRDALGAENRRILQAACDAVKAGDSKALGALMTEAQVLFDTQVAPVCPDELASPGLHRVLSHPAVREHAWGGKGVGSQGDGAAQVICRGEDQCRRLAAVLEGELGVSCMKLVIPPA